MITRALVMALLLISGGCGSPATHVKGAPEHHIEGGYRNPPGSPQYDGSFLETISAYTDRIMENIRGYAPSLSPEYILSRREVSQGLANIYGADALTWLGHASFLIRLGGKTILTDPFLSDYATGSPPFGPKRATPPALTAEKLPQIDILIVSHNHYDHLDAQTIEVLPGKDKVRVVVPLGLGSFFTSRGYKRVTELDWYGATESGGITVTAVPAIHGSARGLFDRNKTLWAGFIFSKGSRQVYFSGDTAYGPVFREIGRKFGPIDFALVPIGVYEPRKRMKSVHTNPAEAVRIGKDLQAGTIISMHWGTIRLSDEAFEEPPGRFRKAAKDNGYAGDSAWVLKIGESRLLQ